MGEYAKFNDQEVKIGTCEDMYYLRHVIAVVTLEELTFRARNRGMMGVAVWNQASNGKPAFVAGCLGKDGSICDPRSWSPMPTIEGALRGLEAAMIQKWKSNV